MNEGELREESPLVARCQACGGAVPIVVSAPSLACTFCGSEAPLPPELSARVEALKARLGRTAAREQQLVGKPARQARGDTAGFVVLSMTLVFALVGAIAFFTPPAPAGIAAREVLFVPRQAKELGDPAVVRFWVVWGIVTCWLFALVLVLLAAARMRRLVRVAFPHEPAAPGRPPRCRCCGAELPEAGAVRRCRACRVDHVVDGVRYQRRARTLERALSGLEAQVERTLASRLAAAQRAMVWAGSLPVLAALGVLIGGVVAGRTVPSLWAATAALLVVAAVLAAGLRSSPPGILTSDEARPGDRLWLGDRLLTVVAELSGLTPPGYGGFRLDLMLLSRDRGRDTELALAFDAAEEVPSARLFRALPGGGPSLPSGPEAGPVADGTLRGEGSPLWPEREGVFTRLVGPGPGQLPSSIQVFRGPRPTGRELPAFTLVPDRSVGGDEVVWAGPAERREARAG